jgi:SPP1 gp7 family putative phage head morphogenesis protein
MAKTRQRRRNQTAAKALSPAAGALARTGAGRTYDTGQVLAALTQATYGQYPFQAMARDPRDRVPFGPLNPLDPQAIDPVRPGTGRPDPRLAEYPVAWNLPGTGERLIPWSVLREAANSVDVMRRCIEIRKARLAGLKWSWQVRPEIIEREFRADGKRGHDDIAAELRERWASEIGRLTAFWEVPWPAQGLEFKPWLGGVMEDRLVLDAVCIYPQTTYGGDLLGLEIIDGATIKPLLDHRGARPQSPYPAFQQIIWGFPRGEFQATTVTDEDGRTVTPGAFLSDQLIYVRENYRSWTPYGFSPTEQALISARLYLRRQGWMLAEYDDGVLPQMVVEAAETLSLTPRERREYENSLNDELTGQTPARHRAKFMFPGTTAKFLPDAAERYKPEYDLFLIKLLASHYGVPASELGFTETRGLGGTGMHEAMKESQDAAGTQPDIAFAEALVNSTSLRLLRAPAELVFGFNDADGESEVDADKMAQDRLGRGTITVNDDRARIGLPRYEIPEADKPFVLGAGGPVFLEGAAARAEQAAATAQAQPEVAAPDDAPPEESPPSQPDAIKAAEARAYRAFVKRGRMREFEWLHHDPGEIAELTKAAADPKASPASGEVVPPPDNRWPAWAVDAALAAYVAGQLRSAMLSFLPLADQFTEWATHQEGITAQGVTSWLRSRGVDVTPAIQGVIRSALVQGYVVGARSAEAVLAHGDPRNADGFTVAVDWGGWRPGNVAAARKVLSEDGRNVGLNDLLDDTGVRISSIAQNRLDEIAAVLADGLERGETPQAIATGLRGVLDDPNWALLTAWTETNRAQSAAALDTYRLAGADGKEWFTANDQRVCPACEGNEAEGAIGLDGTFASGDQHPPAHPRCRCAVISSFDDDVAKSARAAATGHEGDAHRLHEYWTRGEGLAKWVNSPHPWTSLYHRLLRHIKDVDEAKRTAAAWYHDVFHTWPGTHHGSK